MALSSHQGPLVAAAQVSLPVATWAEVDGTFTNRNGQVQRLRSAVQARGEATPAWRVVENLAGKLGLSLDFASPEAVFQEAAARYPFMKGATWGPAMNPVQLRFGRSRG